MLSAPAPRHGPIAIRAAHRRAPFRWRPAPIFWTLTFLMLSALLITGVCVLHGDSVQPVSVETDRVMSTIRYREIRVQQETLPGFVRRFNQEADALGASRRLRFAIWNEARPPKGFRRALQRLPNRPRARADLLAPRKRVKVDAWISDMSFFNVVTYLAPILETPMCERDRTIYFIDWPGVFGRLETRRFLLSSYVPHPVNCGSPARNLRASLEADGVVFHDGGSIELSRRGKYATITEVPQTLAACERLIGNSEYTRLELAKIWLRDRYNIAAAKVPGHPLPVWRE